MDERRVANKQRKSRVAIGGVATPLSLIVAYVFHEIMGKDMSTELAVAVSSIIGSLVGVASICFWDLRGLWLSWWRRSRRQPQPPEG